VTRLEPGSAIDANPIAFSFVAKSKQEPRLRSPLGFPALLLSVCPISILLGVGFRKI
jgi:hypothetical protein